MDARSIADAIARTFGGAPEAEAPAAPETCPHCGQAKAAPDSGETNQQKAFKSIRKGFGNE